ncbi:MAG: hypothetical protein ACRDOO_26625, partial [Actinomadura sp.]
RVLPEAADPVSHRSAASPSARNAFSCAVFARAARRGAGRGPPVAEIMRQLPSRYGDRLTTRTLERIMDAAAAGRWEKAVDQLITALCIHGEPISATERDELGTLVEALGMPSRRIETLTLHS